MLTVRNSQAQSMAQASPGQQMVMPCQQTKSWIEVRLVDDDGNPVPSEKYKIQLPDNSVMEGSLDSDGKVRYDGILPGQAKISFPNLDAQEWKAAS